MVWSAVGSAVGAIGNVAATAMANRANQQLQREQQAHNEKMWEKNNEYNSPVNQRKRIEEAGGNPVVMNSQLTSGNSSSPAQSVQPARMEAPDVGTPISSGFNATAQLMEQRRVNDSVIEKNKADALKSFNEAKNIGDGGVMSSNWQMDLENKRLDNFNKTIQNKMIETQNQIMQKYGDQNAAAQLQSIVNNNAKILEDTKLSTQQRWKAFQDTVESRARIKQIDFNLKKDKDILPLLLQSYALENMGKSILNQGNSFQNSLNQKFGWQERKSGLDSRRLSNMNALETNRSLEKHNSWFEYNQIEGSGFDPLKSLGELTKFLPKF